MFLYLQVLIKKKDKHVQSQRKIQVATQTFKKWG